MNGFLDLRRLRYFKAIAEHGSLSAASRSLNLAQPALSHHVAKLEESIGVPVLRRRRDGAKRMALEESEQKDMSQLLDELGINE